MEKVNLNKSNEVELSQIKRVGIKRAQLIIEGRPYKDIYELSKLNGFGRKTIESIIEQNIVVC